MEAETIRPLQVEGAVKVSSAGVAVVVFMEVD